MKVFRPARVAFLISVACLLHVDKIVAAPGAVPPGACLYALDPTATNAFQIAGAQSVYTACGVVSESSSSSAFEMEGSETLYLQNHAQVSVVGGASLTGQTYLYDTISGKDVQAVQTTNPGDPLSSLSPPTTGTIVGKSHTNYDMNSKPANNTISPGIYCGGLTIGNTNGTTFTFSPGVYILAGGGLVLNSQAVVKGTGVTFYNTSSAGWGCSGTSNYMPITISGQVTATLSAPTSGSFDGILFFGNRTGCSAKGSCVDQINGGSTAILNGALYFASDEMEITASNATGYTMLVADKVYINGNSTFGIDGDPLDGITVAVSPATATLYASQTQQFSATVTNTVNSVVNWSISPAGVGTISSSGLYTAPANITAQQTVTVTATSQADNSKSGAATITLAVTKTTPTITWPTPAAIIYDTALSATQLDATANVAGTFAYTPAAGTVLTAGSQTLSVTFTPTNTTLYNSATDSVTLTVNKATPTLVWSAPAAITYGVGLSTAQLDSTANVAGTFAYSPGAGTVLAAGNQTLTVTFTPTDTTDYTTATASVTLTVSKATPVITWATPPAITYGTALGSAQLNATSSVPGTFAYSPAAGAVLAAGSQTLAVTFTPTNTTDYSTATATVTLTVNKAPTTITWATPAAITYGTALGATQLDATANVAGTFVYSPAAGMVPATGSQTLSVTFTPTDTTDYATAADQVTLTVNQATPMITWATPAAITYGTALSATQLDAAANVPGTFAYSPAAGAVSAAGSQALTVTFTPTDTTDYATATDQVTLTVNQATPAISWAAPAAITYGAALSPTQLDATANVAGTFVYSPAAGTVLAAGSQTLSVTFTPTDTTDYTTATTSVVIAVSQATPQIAWATPASIAYGTALSAMQLDATANVPGTFAYSPAAGTVPAAGSQTLNVTFTPADAADYTTATDSVVLTVNQATQCTPSGYSYERAIIIDHTKVPNTDQVSFPFLFSTTDSLLATTANGGHVQNANGYDIIFTSDPAGQNRLPYEMEEYNPLTGQVVAWVQIPTLSHSSDTTIYLFYGNPGITASQQNPSAVWDSKYLAVWHVPNGTQLSLNDSTSNGNNGTNNGALAVPGEIDGGMSTNGSTFATIGTPADLANLTQGNATFSAWINTPISGNGGVIMGKEDPNDAEAGWAIETWQNTIYFESIYSNQSIELASNATTGESAWSYVAVTLAGTPSQGGQATVYINGVPSGTSSGAGQAGDDSAQTAYLANISWNWPLQGLSDEFRISNTVRSADWIATEYANQSSPSTFYLFSPEGVVLDPISATLYEGQTQQFMAQSLNGCSGSVTYTLNPSTAGNITQSGIYTAPATISTTQTVVLTVTSQSDSTKTATATITLLPPVAVTVTPASASISNGGQQQQFSANVANAANTAVTWSISPAGAGTYPNGVETQFQYDTLNRVSALATQQTGYTYQRGLTGNLTSSTESSGRTENWSYDGIYRLTGETITLAPSGHNGSIGYTLDPVGNRLSDASSVEGIPSGSWGYNSDDEVSSEAYDQNGNVTATGGKSFTYDSENHLMTMTASGTSATIVYDGDGNRVAKTVNGVTTRYLVDDLNPTGYSQVVEELQGGAVTRQYTYGLQRISEDQIVSNTWTPSFYGYDGGGNVRQLTSSTGAVTDSYEYDAYGNSFTVSGSTPNEMMYRGEQLDSDLGLYYLRARYYNPLTGRFMSRDPENGDLADPKTLHKYLYADGDPMNGIDPMGRDSILETGAIDRSFTLEAPRAIVAFVGRVIVLQVIPSTVGAAEAVAQFLADAAEVIGSNGLYRYIACATLGEIFSEAFVDVVNSDAPEGEKGSDGATLSQALEKACPWFVFAEPE